MLVFLMNKILQFIIAIFFIFTFHTNLSASFLVDKIYKSFENKVKENIGMQKPNYNEFISRKKEKKIITPQEREEYIKRQFMQKKDISTIETVIKEEISIETETTQFFDSLNQEHKIPVNME